MNSTPIVNPGRVVRRAFNLPADFVDDDPTLEMELTPAQREMLSRAAEGEPAAPSPPAPRNVPEPVLVLVPTPAQEVIAKAADTPAAPLPPTPQASTPAATVACPVEVAPAESHPLTVEVLTPAVTLGRPNEVSAPPAAAARPRISRVRVSGLAIGLGIIGLCALSAGVAYLTYPNAPAPSMPPPPAEAAPPAPATTTPTPPALPYEEPAEILRVRFANPFDATEVFEFPAGTTEAEARAAVADLLLKRAQERLNPSSQAKHPAQHSPTPENGAPRTRVAKRG